MLSNLSSSQIVSVGQYINPYFISLTSKLRQKLNDSLPSLFDADCLEKKFVDGPWLK
jgi:hypothetical protein